MSLCNECLVQTALVHNGLIQLTEASLKSECFVSRDCSSPLLIKKPSAICMSSGVVTCIDGHGILLCIAKFPGMQDKNSLVLNGLQQCGLWKLQPPLLMPAVASSHATSTMEVDNKPLVQSLSCTLMFV